MHKTNALNIIQTFSEKEICEFTDFLRSPYFNKKSGVVKLFHEIKKSYPDYVSDELLKENLWKRIYPGKKYNYGTMKNLIYDLTNLIERYITDKQYESNEIQKFANLYKAFADRRIIKSILKMNNEFDKMLDDRNLYKIDLSAEEFYQNALKVLDTKMWLSHFLDPTVNLTNDRQLAKELVVCNFLTQGVYIHIMTHALSLNDKVENEELNIVSEILSVLKGDVFSKILIVLEKRSPAKFVLVKCAYLCLIAVDNPGSVKEYRNFKNFFFENFRCLPKSNIDDFTSVLEALMAWCDNPHIDKDSEWFSIYDFKFCNNLVLDRNNEINTLQFIPYVSLFFLQNRLTDLENFYICYHHNLTNVKDREPTRKLVEAIILFMRSDYINALELISRVSFKLPGMNNYSKKIKAMIFYELNDYDLFLSQVDSHMHYCRYTNYVGPEAAKLRLKKVKEFYTDLKNLFALRDNPEQKEIEKYLNAMNKGNHDFKQWFYKKAEELYDVKYKRLYRSKL